jgi:hypothetical protein
MSKSRSAKPATENIQKIMEQNKGIVLYRVHFEPLRSLLQPPSVFSSFFFSSADPEEARQLISTQIGETLNAKEFGNLALQFSKAYGADQSPSLGAQIGRVLAASPQTLTKLVNFGKQIVETYVSQKSDLHHQLVPLTITGIIANLGHKIDEIRPANADETTEAARVSLKKLYSAVSPFIKKLPGDLRMTMTKVLIGVLMEPSRLFYVLSGLFPGDQQEGIAGFMKDMARVGKPGDELWLAAKPGLEFWAEKFTKNNDGKEFWYRVLHLASVKDPHVKGAGPSEQMKVLRQLQLAPLKH